MSSPKTSSKLGRWLAYAALAVLAILGGDLAANAIDISQPSNSTIMGASVCTGSPTASNLLVFGGSTWCGSNTINPPSGTSSALVINDTNANASRTLLELDTSGRTANSRGLYEQNDGEISLQVDKITAGNGIGLTGGILQLSSSGVSYASDLAEVAAPRNTWSCYLRTVSGVATAKAICEYYPAKNTHIQTISYAGLTAAAGCTTNPVVALFDGSTEITASAITLTTNSAVAAQSVGYAFTGGHALSLQVATAPAGCTTSAADYTFTAELTTD